MRGEKRVTAALQAKEQAMRDADSQLQDFFAETKKVNPLFDERDFSEFAVRHKFTINTVEDLKSVLGAYNDLQTKAGNKVKGAKPGDEKIAQSKGGAGETTTDFTDLRTKGGDMHDVVHRALERVKGNK